MRKVAEILADHPAVVEHDIPIVVEGPQAVQGTVGSWRCARVLSMSTNGT